MATALTTFGPKDVIGLAGIGAASALAAVGVISGAEALSSVVAITGFLLGGNLATQAATSTPSVTPVKTPPAT